MASSPSDADAGVAPVYRDDPRLVPLIGPGAPYEVEAVVLDGVALRDFVRAPRTILDVFRMGAAHESLVNIVYEKERLTFADVRRRSHSLARELQSTFDVRPGDRVAIAMRNLPEFVVSFWGAVLVGAIVVPLNSWWAGGELVYALQNAGASLLVADEERLERVLDAGRPDGLTLVGVRTDRGDVPFHELTTGAPLDDDAIARLAPDDPVTLMYTSGTTGRPKGALGTSRAMIANLWNMAFVNAREAIVAGRTPGAARQPATLSTGPLFHIGGMSSIVGAPLGGAKMVLMRKWDVGEAVRLAREEHVTGVGGVPAVAQQVVEDPRAVGLDVRTFPMGGAPVPPDLVARALHTFGDTIQVFNGYGLTETTSAVVANVGVEFAARPDSVGRPNLTADVRIVDAEGDPLGPGEVGEICIRSPQVVKGYWNDDAATKSSFTDGWFHSGDIGYVDHEGYVYVVDRMKDVVIRGGENVYCVEVEAVLHEHPGVAEVAIVGLDEPTMGERVCAVVVPRPGVDVDLTDVRAYAAARLAGFKCPEALYLAVELPKNATGKVEKRVLRAAVANAAGDVERVVMAHVMGGAGFYNRHSAQQEAVATAGVAMLERAAQNADAATSGPVVVADFGCRQGKNSMHPLSVAIDALQARLTTAGSIVVVHTDLPDNDFSSLFDTVATDPDSYRRAGVFSYATGQSFYDQLFPDAAVVLGWSATAAVWLRATPCELPDHLFSFAESGPRREQWKEAAARDWQTFLRHRARELHRGGQLVVSLPVAGPAYLEWMHVVEAGAREARDRGVVSPAEYAAMVLPTYLSEPDDLRVAVERLDGLVLDEFETGVAADPAYTSFREHHDPARYASDAVDLFRAWAGPTLTACLDAARDADARATATDGLFASIRDALAAAPTECPWSIGLLRMSRI